MHLFRKQTLILVGIDLLLLLLAYPLAHLMRTEWDEMIAANQALEKQVMQSTQASSAVAAAPSPEPEAGSRRDRSLLKPIPLTTDGSAALDPFLREARRRAKENPEAAMDWLQNQASGTERLRGMLEVVALWAAEDSENALLWLESNAQGVARLETLNSGVELWAQQDPATASQWIEGMANDGSKLSAAKALAANWAEQNVTEASQWVASLPNGILREEAASALIETWANQSPQDAAIWALSEAELSGNTKLLLQSIEEYATANPIEAEGFLRSLTRAYDAPEAVETYVRSLARSDPQEAIAWISNLSPQDPLYLRNNPEIVLQEWSRTDSVAASAWLNDAPAGPQRDAAIVGFANTMLDFEPEAAAAWANTISDAETRLSYLQRSIDTWARTQPVEALRWVQSAELSPSLRSSLAENIAAD